MRQAVGRLEAYAGITVERASPVYEARAHTRRKADVQPPYLNAVVEIRTALCAEDVLALCQELEAAAGRNRLVKWMPRTLDLDLLTLGQRTRLGPYLVLPHPRLADRRFVLRPWADLAPNLHVPHPFDATVTTLLDRCPDTDEPRRTSLSLHSAAYSPVRSS